MSNFNFELKDLAAAEAARANDEQRFVAQLLNLPPHVYQSEIARSAVLAAGLGLGAYALTTISGNTPALSQPSHPSSAVAEGTVRVASVSGRAAERLSSPTIKIAYHTKEQAHPTEHHAKKADVMPLPQTVTVEQGDTVTSIAKDQHKTVKQLIGSNPDKLRNPDMIYPGEVLSLHDILAASRASEKEETYTVVKGDNLSGIAKDHGETLKELEADNPAVRSHPNDIQVGDKLLVEPGHNQPHQPHHPRHPHHLSHPKLKHEHHSRRHLTTQIKVKALASADVNQILPAAKANTVANNTPKVMAALKEQGIDNQVMVAYTFATINAETSSFEPIPEWASGREYEGRTDLGNTEPGDGVRFKGRGFIQLTGRSNYENMSAVLGIDLVSNPDLALDADVAARILAVWLDAHKGRIMRAIDRGDLASARAVVNGRNRHTGLPNGLQPFTTAFNVASNVVIEASTPPPPAAPETPVDPTPETPPTQTPVAPEAITTQDQAKQLCNSLGVEYSGIMQGYLEGEAHDIFTCRIPQEFLSNNDAHFINVTLIADLMGLMNDLKVAGKDAKIISAFRTMDLSKELRRTNGCADIMLTPPGECDHPTAIPGFSNHQMGEAFDLVHADGSALSNNDSDYDQISALAAQHNLHANVANDANHFSPSGK